MSTRKAGKEKKALLQKGYRKMATEALRINKEWEAADADWEQND